MAVPSAIAKTSLGTRWRDLCNTAAKLAEQENSQKFPTLGHLESVLSTWNEMKTKRVEEKLSHRPALFYV